MTNGDEFAERGADVLIAGAGLAGLTAAFGFAQAGFDVVSSGPAERTGRGAPSPCSTSRSPFSSRLASGRVCNPRLRRCAPCVSSTTPGRYSRHVRLNFWRRKSGSTRSAGTSRTTGWPRPSAPRSLNLVASSAFRSGFRLMISAPTPSGPGSRTDASSQPGWRSAPMARVRERGATLGLKRASIVIHRAR